MKLFNIPDIRLFWSEDQRFLSQFTENKVSEFKPFSKYPPTYKDLALWVPDDFSPNSLFDVVRGVAGDIVEKVLLCLSITCGLWSSKFNQQFCFSLLSITAADLSENKNVWLNGVKRWCSCAVIGRIWPTSSVSVFLWLVGCHRNYDWRQ